MHYTGDKVTAFAAYLVHYTPGIYTIWNQDRSLGLASPNVLSASVPIDSTEFHRLTIRC